MRLLGGVLRDRAGLIGESEIAIAGSVGHLHCRIAGQCGCNSEFLLRPINVGDRVAWWWLDQSAQPNARPENVLGIARLIAPSARSKRRENRAVASVAADGEIVEAQIGQRA